jgi:hypothetical protein
MRFLRNYSWLAASFVLVVLQGVLPRLTNAQTKKPNPSRGATENRTANETTAHYVIYKNKKYRFRVELPDTWSHFSILVSEWGGAVMHGEGTPVSESKGPTITIRHPSWSAECPRQDIPIMIFTRDQWDLVEKDGMILSAAPVGPSEIGRNRKYVFALPARYNYALPVGWEEVAQIIAGHAFAAY